MERKLASIRRIEKLDAIPDADKIVKATVGGWTLVTAKDNGFMPGDLAIYFEIDSFLPVEERFEFLRKACFKSTKNLGDGFRLRTIKLKGTLSQGLIMPLERGENDSGTPAFFVTDTAGEKHEVSEGDDVTEWLGIQLYEKPIPANLAGKIKGNFPILIRKTDQERIQNLVPELLGMLDVPWEVTLKLDGSSMTVYHRGGDIGVCSRNIDLFETEDNLFWQVTNRLRIPAILKWIGKNLAFQGELMGPGVQGNREWLKTHTFFLYDIWDCDNQRYFSPSERRSLLDVINNSGFELPHIHVMENEVRLKKFGTTKEDLLKNLLEYAEGPSIYHDVREGVVFKRTDGQLSFKVIANKFLIDEKG